MSVYTIFKEAFADVMARNGFIYKNKVFIRIHGDGIIQAVSLKGGIEYSFYFNMIPLLGCIEMDRGDYSNMANHYWSLVYEMTYNGFEGFPYDGYSIYDDEEDVIYNLPHYNSKKPEQLARVVEAHRKAAELFETMYLPILDGVTDFHKYLEFKTTDYSTRFLIDPFFIDSDTLVYKAYLDGNFDFGRNYIEVIHERERRLWKKEWEESQRFLLEPPDEYEPTDIDAETYEEYLEEEEADFEETVQEDFRTFLDSMEKNDASWILPKAEKLYELHLDVFKQNFPLLFQKK